MFCMTPGAGFIRTHYSYEVPTDPRAAAVYGVDRIGFGRMNYEQKYSQGETNMLIRILLNDKYRMIEPDYDYQRKLITPTEI